MKTIFLWAITVALAGFLFGFDTAVISGADLPIQQLWQTDPLFHGMFIMSSALWGTVIGALFGSVPCDRFGRKATLIAIGILYILSALGSALAADPYTFSFMRFIGGLGVGISSIAVPAYIAEIAPAKHRGRLVAMYQFQIVFGILVAFFSNYLLSGISAEDWRWMLGVEVIPAMVFLFLVFKVSESPRWLILHKRDEAAARVVFNQLQEKDVDSIVSDIKRTRPTGKKSSLFSTRYRFPVMLAFFVAFFNQLSGINFIIYFAPRIFSLAGLDSDSALLSSAGVGIVNLIFTMLGLYLIDRAGRRLLMLIGSVGYIVSLSVVAYAFYAGIGGMAVVFFVFLFIASHAIGQGAVIWVFISEVFPNAVRAKGQSLGASTHWVFAALIALLMPFFLSVFTPATIFIFFAFMMVLQLVFVLFVMPETKGRTLESISEEVQTEHPEAIVLTK
ncbi:MFS transporter, sugar porter (SP) family [Rheinheimera pacifica]|uniref:MFS transporter, sugar porter (SP) family n=1 Tax=Rheinheimera pacifica TaxID=173990 RepID=A0A1H6K6K2_9GAMM|nr:sugar porter family MFS transporter [Rheinheimera pacifica]SEH67430.1 MFS transporter, sugar porter (SP) family [Rheinheimera pacifica]